MSLNANDMAEAIRVAMNFPLPLTSQIIGWSGAVLDELKAGVAGFGGSPTHSISGLTGPSLASRIQIGAGYPSISPELSLYASGMTAYILSGALVTYTGPPTSGTNPDWFQGGTISGMVGSAMATTIATSVAFPFVSPELINKCTAIVDYIQSNAEVESGVIS